MFEVGDQVTLIERPETRYFTFGAVYTVTAFRGEGEAWPEFPDMCLVTAGVRVRGVRNGLSGVAGWRASCFRLLKRRDPDLIAKLLKEPEPDLVSDMVVF